MAKNCLNLTYFYIIVKLVFEANSRSKSRSKSVSIYRFYRYDNRNSMTSLEKTLAIREKRHDFDPSYVYIDLYIILNYIHKHEYVTGNKMWTYTNKAAMIAAVATNPLIDIY